MTIEEEERSSYPDSKNPTAEDEVQNLDKLYVNLDVDDEIDIHPIEYESSVSTQRVKKRISKAWDYFEKTLVNGVLKARCYHCKALLTAVQGSRTSHLLKHVQKVCPGRHLGLGDGR